MPTLRTIRLRIRGTKSIKQITRAMEAVSAVKMRKSQGVALAARPYATAALRLLKNLQANMQASMQIGGPIQHFLATRLNLVKKTGGNTLLIVVTSDKGLAGSFNTNVLKKAEAFIKQSGDAVSIAAVGKKAADYFSRRGRRPVVSWTGFGDYAELSEVEPLFAAVMDFVLAGRFDKVFITYTNFLSALKQEVAVRKLLPFDEKGLEEMIAGIAPERGRFADTTIRMNTNTPTDTIREYLFEPSPKEIFESLLPALLKIQMYHAVLEANASEHSSRMIAMRNATENAGELIQGYTVSLNKARQSAINKELAEITAGASALEM